MSLAGVAEHSIRRHRRRGLDHDDAVKDEVPEREGPAQPRGGRDSRSGDRVHESPIGVCGTQDCQSQDAVRRCTWNAGRFAVFVLDTRCIYTSTFIRFNKTFIEKMRDWTLPPKEH